MPVAYLSDQSEIYYEIHGSGKPILFIHPPGMGLVTFKQQLPLSESYQVITYDMRGNGNSKASREEISISLLAKDINELLNHLKLEKVCICGYSNGGSVALEFVLTFPERVDGVILLGGFPEVNTFLLRTEFLLGIYTVKMRGLSVLARVLGKAHGKSKEYQKEIENDVLKANPTILHRMYVEGLSYKCTDRLSEIKSPVLLVDGAVDFYLHKYQKHLEQNIKDSTLVFISKAKHQIPTKHAKELNQIIAGFLEKISYTT
ncbi:alpha/beta fold hydrolase [Litchfieldia salsa]|uniref:Pimeloyl-ACP methyl ester carboxylesterase n=1 Tax=Litchfieldia salsa TaxID=930152 RepID=A0A1H0RPW7_9BACI|nr:alpha/beta hydrolase [Litchfieldia salsa]SDP31006.1 Pimeloyl-ACP methyl ester carboxylesterase [Litchfieldia salsa]